MHNKKENTQLNKDTLTPNKKKHRFSSNQESVAALVRDCCGGEREWECPKLGCGGVNGDACEWCGGGCGSGGSGGGGANTSARRPDAITAAPKLLLLPEGAADAAAPAIDGVPAVAFIGIDIGIGIGIGEEEVESGARGGGRTVSIEGAEESPPPVYTRGSPADTARTLPGSGTAGLASAIGTSEKSFCTPNSWLPEAAVAFIAYGLDARAVEEDTRGGGSDWPGAAEFVLPPRAVGCVEERLDAKLLIFCCCCCGCCCCCR